MTVKRVMASANQPAVDRCVIFLSLYHSPLPLWHLATLFNELTKPEALILVAGAQHYWDLIPGSGAKCSCHWAVPRLPICLFAWCYNIYRFSVNGSMHGASYSSILDWLNNSTQTEVPPSCIIRVLTSVTLVKTTEMGHSACRPVPMI